PPCGPGPRTELGGGACPGGQVCAPAPPQPTAAVPCACRTAECATATDCHGPLPQFCLTCGCAHWACEAGRCVVEVCSPTPRERPPHPREAARKRRRAPTGLA